MYDRAAHRVVMDRRTFLGRVVTGTGALAVGSASAAAQSSSGIVSTRDHFDITWYGSIRRTSGTTPTNYDVEGAVPGLDGSTPGELVVFVHGWRNDSADAEETFAEATAALDDEGYDRPVVGYSWDSDTSYARWWSAVEIAERNGPKLARFTRDLAAASPGTTVRYVAHSLGATVVLEGLKSLASAGETGAVESVSLLGGAADNDAVAVDGEFGDAIESAAGRLDNFWKSDDRVLDWAYATAEFDSAVGEEGCEGTPPANYTDVNVDYVPDHSSYYERDEGCIPAVVERW